MPVVSPTGELYVKTNLTSHFVSLAAILLCEIHIHIDVSDCRSLGLCSQVSCFRRNTIGNIAEPTLLF